MNRQLVLPVLCLIPALFLPQILDAVGEGFLIGLATRIVIYSIAAMSLNFILGYGGMISFGHAAYFGVGAYVVAILSHHAFEASTIFGLPGTDFALVSMFFAILFQRNEKKKKHLREGQRDHDEINACCSQTHRSDNQRSKG